eukprot:c1809_g1_i1.p1 GENE.c1809_g1_i1~~c1809_g1_i1.p1  ORF type:complete len:817 (-),score=158.19 c1809_g1_i1:46-2466(-)
MDRTRPPSAVAVPRKHLATWTDADGMPIIVNAIYKDNVVAVGILLMAGADPNAKDSLQCSVLEHACSKRNAKIVALLVKMGAKVEDEKTTTGAPIKDIVESIIGNVADFQSEDNNLLLQPFPFNYRYSDQHRRSRAMMEEDDYLEPSLTHPQQDQVFLVDSMDDTTSRLQSACCMGEIQTIMSILNLPNHIPPILTRLDEFGHEILRRPRERNLENAKVYFDQPVFDQPGGVDQPQSPQSTSAQPTVPAVPAVTAANPPIPTPPQTTQSPRTQASAPPRVLKSIAQSGKSTSAVSSEATDMSDESDDDEDMFESKAKPTKKEVRKTIDFADIDKMIQEQCDELCVFFDAFSPKEAEMVLRQFEWDLDLQKLGELMDQGYDETKFRQVSGLLTKTPLPLPSRTRSCDICVEDKPPSAFLSLGCQHQNFCADCWRTYLETRANDGIMECLKTPCIGHTTYLPCGLIVPQSFFEKHATPSAYLQYKKRRLEEFVMNNKKRLLAFCPGPDCQRICAADVGLKAKDVVEQSLLITCTCELQTFCMGCVAMGDLIHKARPHAPATCKNVADWVKKTTEEGRYFTFRVKHCPNSRCRAAIVKCGCQGRAICDNLDHCPNQACNHMHCKNCNTHFCWICGNMWEDHNNFYSCNKQLSAELTPVEFFKSCLERYDDHMKSHKLTRERVSLSYSMYEFFRTQCPSSIQNDVFTESNEEMSKCYVILAYSYVRRHYTQFAHDAEKSLYEHQQGMLENHTNQLMGKYENFKKKFDSQSRDLADLQDEVIKMREYTKLLQTFRQNMVQSFTKGAKPSSD